MKYVVACSGRGWLAVLTLFCMFEGSALAEENIDPINKYAWAENAGWLNFSPTDGGVTVVRNGANGYLAGYVWAENIGWLKLGNDNGGPYQNTGADDWGVDIASGGSLTGYAWSENCGWIRFNLTHSQVTIAGDDGRFDGYAWAENIGWIIFAMSYQLIM